VPALLALKLPEVFSLLALTGILYALLVAARPGTVPQRRAVHFALAFAALLPVAATVITRPAMYNGIRHFVFVLPPLAVAGGLAGRMLVERAMGWGRVPTALIVT